MKITAFAALGVAVLVGATARTSAQVPTCLEDQHALIAAAVRGTVEASRLSEERYVWHGTVPVHQSLLLYGRARGWPVHKPTTAGAFGEPPLPDIASEQRARLGADHPYLAEWKANEERARFGCFILPCRDLPAIRGTYSPAVQSLAESDVRYQRAMAHFNGGHVEAAYGLFKEIAAIEEDPWRINAAHMIVRSLMATQYRPVDSEQPTPRELDRLKLIAKEISAIGNDPAFAEIQAWARLTLDVATYNSQEPHLLAGQLDGIAARRAYDDMAYDLTWFIWPEVRDSMGWWLRPQPISHHYSEAVRLAASRHDVIDWLQADIAAIGSIAKIWRNSGSFDFKLDDPVPAHAWERWRTTGRAIWLRPYARRVLPSDEARTNLFELVAEANRRLEACELDGDWAAAYPALIEGAVRVYAVSSGSPHGAPTADAREILTAAGGLPAEHRGFIRRAVQQLHIRMGDWRARLWTELARDEASAGDLLLAKELSVLADVTARQSRVLEWQELTQDEPRATETGNYDGFAEIRSFLDFMPVRVLLDFAHVERVPTALRKAIIRTAWLRAWLLDKRSLLQEATTLLRQTHPELETDLQAIDSARTEARAERARLLMVLRNPGFTLRLFVRSRGYLYRENLPIATVNSLHLNDGNWWCSYRILDLRRDVRRFFRGSATDWIGGPSHPELSEAFLYDHPLLRLADPLEISRLSSIGNGASFLSGKAIALARRMTWLDRTLGRDDDIPEMLHLAVRTTRWSCPRESPHGAYSREAFQLLHQRYGDTPWARRTPFWYHYPSLTMTFGR